MKLERRRIKAVAGRKLACFAAAFSVLLWAFCYGIPHGQSILFGGVAGIVLFLLLWPLTDLRQSAITVGLALLLASPVFYLGVWRNYADARALDGTRGTHTVEVTAYPREGDYYTAIEGARLVGSRQRVTVLVYETGLDLQSGDFLTVDARVSLNAGAFFFSSMDDGSFLTLRVSDMPVHTKPEKIPLRYLPLRVSHYVRQEIIYPLLPGDEGALLASLLTGGTEGMSRGFKNDLSLSGTSHITSVSGLHMAILSGAMIALFGRFWGAVTALPLMVVFGMLTGMDPPVIRSILMLAIVFLAFAANRENDGITTVLTALMLIGIADPCSMVSLSLQLSFAAVAGLLLLSDPIKRTLAVFLPAEWSENRGVDSLLAGFSVSIAATIASLPLTALHFDRVSILSALTNLAVLWLISALMGLGAAMILLWFVLPPISRLIARYMLRPLLKLFILPISFIAELPFSSVEADNRTAMLFLLLWGILLCVGYKIRPRVRLPLFAGMLALTIGIVGLTAWQRTQNLVCTVYGDGMVILEQGRDACILLPGGEAAAYAEDYESRLYEMGDLKADALVFNGTVGQAAAQAFSADTVYLPGNTAQTMGNLSWYTADAQLVLGDLTVSSYGPKNQPYSLLIEWEGHRIFYACGSEAGEDMPDGTADLLILDEVLACAAHQRRALFARVTPAQIVACDAEAGHDFDYLTTANGPTLWLGRNESVTYIYETR
ncbi:MAG: ComEC/Rec2 family competence protein [Clostridia bacterium]|nr:ComEC/Rec2 family competence protein [Clostridia bacterium]